LFSYKTEAVRRRQESLSIATELISKLQMDRWASSFLYRDKSVKFLPSLHIHCTLIFYE
jgi:hypothetical protein